MSQPDKDAPKVFNFVLAFIIVIVGLVIIVSNFPYIPRRAPATRALGEIQSIELAITKMVSDAGQSGMSSLFDVPAVERERDALLSRTGISPIQAATEIYTVATYALLRHGRGAPMHLESDPTTKNLADVLDRSVVRHLGTAYLDLATDPWGNDYQIYPGPWRSRDGVVPFRYHLSESLGGALPSDTVYIPDMLSRVIEDPQDGPTVVGYPSPQDQLAFIWSFGGNGQNDQPHAGGPGFVHYRNEAAPEHLGGGDDVNNWDPNRSWERHY